MTFLPREPTDGDRKIGFVASLFIGILLISVFAVQIYSYNAGFQSGHASGFVDALQLVKDKAHIDFQWSRNDDGSYTVELWSNDQLVTTGLVEAHVLVKHYREGTLLSMDHHAGVVTTIGLNWIEDQLGDSPSTDPADYISTSNDASSPSAAWTQIPNEIVANGLTRAQGSYTSTGDGVWTIDHDFSVSGTQSVQLYGLQYGASGDNNLLCSDTSAQKNCVNGDTLSVTFTITVT